MTKTLLFLIMACAFFWLFLDQIYGNHYIANVVKAMIPASAE